MKYQIMQYYEQNADIRQLWYKMQAIGKRTEHPAIEISGAENLLYHLYEAKRMDKDFEIEWPKLPVDSGVMASIKRAFENGWFELSAPTTSSLVTYPTETTIP